MEDISKNIICTSLSIKRFIDSVIDSFSLKGSQGRILKFVEENESVTASEIEEYFNLTKATVSDHINALEVLGYIKRTTDKVDARKKIIILTDEGKIISNKIKERLSDYNKNISSILSEEEKETLNNLLKKVNQKIKEEGHV